MVKLDKIYTRGGDQGMTSLGTGERVSKVSTRILAIGSLDLTNAMIGMAAVACADAPWIQEQLQHFQNDLFDCGADLAMPSDSKKGESALRITKVHVGRLEDLLDRVTSSLPPLTSFVLPGGSWQAATLHIARASARQSESHLWALAGEQGDLNPLLMVYLNRLSDVLFVLARLTTQTDNKDLWQPGKLSGQKRKEKS